MRDLGDGKIWTLNIWKGEGKAREKKVGGRIQASQYMLEWRTVPGGRKQATVRRSAKNTRTIG